MCCCDLCFTYVVTSLAGPSSSAIEEIRGARGCIRFDACVVAIFVLRHAKRYASRHAVCEHRCGFPPEIVQPPPPSARNRSATKLRSRRACWLFDFGVNRIPVVQKTEVPEQPMGPYDPHIFANIALHGHVPVSWHAPTVNHFGRAPMGQSETPKTQLRGPGPGPEVNAQVTHHFRHRGRASVAWPLHTRNSVGALGRPLNKVCVYVF